MRESFRTKVVQTVCDEISLLSGGRFEQFTYRVLDVIHPPQSEPWIERGTTITGAPRGYTIDTSVDGASIIAEVSSEADYFDDKLTKPTRDVEHAVKLHPSVKSIYLLSSREATPTQATTIANLVTTLKSSHPSLDSISVLDARALAVQIYNNLESESLIRSLISFLPSIEHLADEHAFSHRIPEYDDYRPRVELEDLIREQLIKEPAILLAGISGIGKSAIAAHVAHSLQDAYDSIFWIAGKDIQSITALTDIDIRRNGVHHNLLATMRQRRCLAIIDDIGFPWNEVKDTDFGISRIIATSQVASDTNTISVQDVSDEIATEIINSNVTDLCPKVLLSRVFAQVGGHPLLLSALNRLARFEGWSAVEDCLPDASAALEDDRHQKISRRILRHHLQPLRDEIAFVRWCDCQSFDIELGKVCVNSRVTQNLHKRGFLSAAEYGNAKIHDVVFASILSEVTVTREQASIFSTKLQQFIGRECCLDRSGLHRISNQHSCLMQRLLREERSSAFVYAVALARTPDTHVEDLNECIQRVRDVSSTPFSPDREIEIRAIIESVEAKYTILSQSQGKEAARNALIEDIAALTSLMEMPNTTGEIKRDLRHHYAKMLTRLSKKTEAEAEFNKILTDYPTCAAARLQLSRLLAQNKRIADAISEAKVICEQYKTSPEEVSPHVLLEALRVIASNSKANDILLQQEVITTALKESGDYNRQMSVQLVSAIAQKTWFTNPEFVSSLFDSIEWGNVVPSTDADRFEWAQAHKSAAKAYLKTGSDHKPMLRLALEHFRSIRKPSDYYLTHHAECAYLLEEYEEANTALEQTSENERNDFWLYRKAQVLNALGRFSEACHCICECIEKTEDQKYTPSRLVLRHQIRRNQNNPDEAKADLLAAIEMLPADDKYRAELTVLLLCEEGDK